MAEEIEVSLGEARAAAVRVLRTTGWDAEDAEVQADVMLYAECHGNNQGLVKLYDPSNMAPAAGVGHPAVERDTPLSAVVNGNQAPGMLVLRKAVDLAAAKAHAGGGLALVGCRNTSTSSGMLAYYGTRLAKAGLISIIVATSPESVSMVPGAAKVFGTNPICFSFPREAAGVEPLVFDMSTSAVAFFGVMEAKAKGQRLAPGAACLPDGTPTTDPEDILSRGASILPFGGHKGAALSLMAELLGSVLPGAAVLGQLASKREAKDWGHVVVAIKPSLLTDSFGAKVDTVLAAVKASSRDGAPIRLPGDQSNALAAEVERVQRLKLPKSLWESLQKSGGGASKL